jgi:hypothetical protein
MRIRRIKPNLVKGATLVGALSMFIALVSAAVISPASAASNARLAASQAIPVPPAGWHPQTITRPWLDPHAKTWIETLSPAACSALNHQHPGAAPNCTVRDYVTGQKGQPLPKATRFITENGANAAAASATWYQFDYTFSQCGLSCSIWSDSFEINGVYNGIRVWYWNIWNTPSTNGPSATTTWTGVRDNGGAYLSWCGCNGMQFGEDATITAYAAGSELIDDTWQRVWVDVWGTWFDYTDGS